MLKIINAITRVPIIDFSSISQAILHNAKTPTTATKHLPRAFRIEAMITSIQPLFASDILCL